jgi:hypothetical protein
MNLTQFTKNTVEDFFSSNTSASDIYEHKHVGSLIFIIITKPASTATCTLKTYQKTTTDLQTKSLLHSWTFCNKEQLSKSVTVATQTQYLQQQQQARRLMLLCF